MYIFIDEKLHSFWFLAHFPQVHNKKKIILDCVSRGALTSWLTMQSPCKYPKPELVKSYTLSIVLGYLFNKYAPFPLLPTFPGICENYYFSALHPRAQYIDVTDTI